VNGNVLVQNAVWGTDSHVNSSVDKRNHRIPVWAHSYIIVQITGVAFWVHAVFSSTKVSTSATVVNVHAKCLIPILFGVKIQRRIHVDACTWFGQKRDGACHSAAVESRHSNRALKRISHPCHSLVSQFMSQS
jgi:hypothetical protein